MVSLVIWCHQALFQRNDGRCPDIGIAKAGLAKKLALPKISMMASLPRLESVVTLTRPLRM